MTSAFSLANRLVLHLLSLNPEWGAIPCNKGRYVLFGIGGSDPDIRVVNSAVDVYMDSNPLPDGFDFVACDFERECGGSSQNAVTFAYFEMKK